MSEPGLPSDFWPQAYALCRWCEREVPYASLRPVEYQTGTDDWNEVYVCADCADEETSEDDDESHAL